jgi:hypothetical protein
VAPDLQQQQQQQQQKKWLVTRGLVVVEIRRGHASERAYRYEGVQ